MEPLKWGISIYKNGELYLEIMLTFSSSQVTQKVLKLRLRVYILKISTFPPPLLLSKGLFQFVKSIKFNQNMMNVSIKYLIVVWLKML